MKVVNRYLTTTHLKYFMLLPLFVTVSLQLNAVTKAPYHETKNFSVKQRFAADYAVTVNCGGHVCGVFYTP